MIFSGSIGSVRIARSIHICVCASSFVFSSGVMPPVAFDGVRIILAMVFPLCGMLTSELAYVAAGNLDKSVYNHFAVFLGAVTEEMRENNTHAVNNAVNRVAVSSIRD